MDYIVQTPGFAANVKTGDVLTTYMKSSPSLFSSLLKEPLILTFRVFFSLGLRDQVKPPNIIPFGIRKSVRINIYLRQHMKPIFPNNLER